jgi:hypothetical protein
MQNRERTKICGKLLLLRMLRNWIRKLPQKKFPAGAQGITLLFNPRPAQEATGQGKERDI